MNRRRRRRRAASSELIAFAILEAAQYFLGRLPEAFAGYERALTDYPVEYPAACSPQAWGDRRAALPAAHLARPRSAFW
jgi:glycogen debranching enzyme